MEKNILSSKSIPSDVKNYEFCTFFGLNQLITVSARVISISSIINETYFSKLTESVA